MSRAALRIVEKPSFETREAAFGSPEGRKECHSLHFALSCPQQINPDIPRYLIEKYSKRGDIVLDPFCGTGAVPLEAALEGRVGLGSDLSPFACLVAGAKLAPADITEVTLWIQSVLLNRPVSLDQYRGTFSPFFEIETYRELLNLRTILGQRQDKISRFIMLLALSSLHGHTAGFLSVYTFPQISLTPSAQEELNIKRGQHPDYRAVAPRLLRKAALLGRDGYPSCLTASGDKHRVVCRDARDLEFVKSESVQLVVSAPPLPTEPAQSAEQWLRLWFAGLDKPVSGVPLDVGQWQEFMNESLFELARVVRSGGRAALDLREVVIDGAAIRLDEVLIELVSTHLSRYWEAESLLVQSLARPQLKESLRERDENKLRCQSRLLVLRRR